MENRKNENNNLAKQKTEKINTVEKVPIAKTKSRHKNGMTLAIVALSILLGLSVIFGITAAFFSANAAAAGNITLGDPVNIDITQGGAKVTTLTFAGNAMPGTVYDQPIAVSVPAATSDAVLRGKLTITNSDTAATNVTAVTTADWVLGADEYYYHNGKVVAGDSVDFVTSVTVPKTLTNADANKTFALSVQIEAIQFANGAAAEVWTTAPAEWTTAYGTGTIVG